MKKTLLMLLVLIASAVAKAQEMQTVYDITVTAQDDKSGIWLVIGEENLANVEELTLSGTINGYDFMIMRDKMHNLHKLDMTNVRIVANDYQYYSGFHSVDDEISPYVFFEKSLNEVKLPETIKAIGSYAFKGNPLTEISIPSEVETIDIYAFNMCRSNTLDISNCKKLKTISTSAFAFNNFAEIRLPNSIKNLDTYAFSNNTSLRHVYVQPILPRQIPTNVFHGINLSNVTLHVPPMTKDDYYWATTWSGFGTIVEDVNPDYFYVDADLTIAENRADVKTVDADVEVNGGIINEDTHMQAFNKLNIASDGTNSGSLIPDDNITANDLCFNITITGNRWYFFSFPFRVELSNFTAPGAYVIRRYNGSTRASGDSGWENLPAETEYLESGVGYIFQCNKSGTLMISVESPDFNWASMTTTNTLEVHTAASDQDASWNFVGNPLICYYDIDDLSYDAPLTIWNGTNYVAYRPGDDNYQLHPFEAFFVQKPDGNTEPVYNEADRMTYTQATNHHKEKVAAARRATPNHNRQLLNLVLSDGEQSDRTRVVFNEKKTTNYEKECDASKFMSMEQVPQLYSVNAQTRYAINERPQGSVQVGYVTPKAGTYTLKVERMDMPMVLKDNVTGITHDLGNGEYTFESEAGTFESRFMLMLVGETTGINAASADKDDSPAYSLDGRQLPQGKTAKGVVVEKGKKVIK